MWLREEKAAGPVYKGQQAHFRGQDTGERPVPFACMDGGRGERKKEKESKNRDGEEESGGGAGRERSGCGGEGEGAERKTYPPNPVQAKRTTDVPLCRVTNESELAGVVKLADEPKLSCGRRSQLELALIRNRRNKTEEGTDRGARERRRTGNCLRCLHQWR